MEEYFCFLIKKIFPTAQLTSDQAGNPDCIMEGIINGQSHVIIIEFSTKFYKISSLYNKSSQHFIDDLDRILFSQESSDRGEMVNLNRYINDYNDRGVKKIIPILVTENWIGDFDLLNRIDDKILNKKIEEHKLDNLLIHKPIFLSLDDLEMFWAISTKGSEIEEFVSSLERWEKEEKEKEKHLYNYASYITDDKPIVNEGYIEYFDTTNL